MTNEEIFKKRLKRCSNALNKLVDDAKKIWPDANLYVDDGVLHLLSGASHDGRDLTARQDRIIASECTIHLGGGGW